MPASAYAKAIVGTLVGLAVPFIGITISSLQPGSDGGTSITTAEWLTAVLAALSTGAIGGATVYAVPNKPQPARAADPA